MVQQSKKPHTDDLGSLVDCPGTEWVLPEAEALKMLKQGAVMNKRTKVKRAPVPGCWELDNILDSILKKFEKTNEAGIQARPMRKENKEIKSETKARSSGIGASGFDTLHDGLISEQKVS